jgi:hypothetical protein
MLSDSGSSSRRFLGRALAASLALHLLIALAVPELSERPGTRPEIDTISFQRVTRIAIDQPPRQVPALRRVAAVRPPQAVKAVRHAEPALKPAPVAALGTPAPRPVTQPHPAPAASEAPAAIARAAASPVPIAPATPAAREVANVEHPPAGYMPFGAEERDPVLDPGVRKQIEALGVRVTIEIRVTDDGRTKDVVFQTPVPHDVESQIEALLADATWDPAYCGGGIPCAGAVTLKL